MFLRGNTIKVCVRGYCLVAGRRRCMITSSFDLEMVVLDEVQVVRGFIMEAKN